MTSGEEWPNFLCTLWYWAVLDMDGRQPESLTHQSCCWLLIRLPPPCGHPAVARLWDSVIPSWLLPSTFMITPRICKKNWGTSWGSCWCLSFTRCQLYFWPSPTWWTELTSLAFFLKSALFFYFILIFTLSLYDISMKSACFLWENELNCRRSCRLVAALWKLSWLECVTAVLTASYNWLFTWNDCFLLQWTPRSGIQFCTVRTDLRSVLKNGEREQSLSEGAGQFGTLHLCCPRHFCQTVIIMWEVFFSPENCIHTRRVWLTVQTHQCWHFIHKKYLFFSDDEPLKRSWLLLDPVCGLLSMSDFSHKYSRKHQKEKEIPSWFFFIYTVIPLC